MVEAPEWVPKLESFILEKMAETRLPGLSIAVVSNGEVVYQRGFGYRDVEKSLPATPRTVYGVGSITKTFTAIAVLQLVEEGKLSLDDPVEKYLGFEFRAMGEPVTVENLLTHTSGYPSFGYAEALLRGVLEVSREAWLPVSTPDDVLAFIRGAGDWAVARPGERFFYLNEGYVILGRIVEKVSGLSYEDYVRKNILEPLGMERTYFSREEVEGDTDVAAPYIIAKDGRVVRSRFPYGITADGGMLSNVLDLVKFITMLINRGRYGDAQILPSSTVAEMEKPRVRLPYELFGDESYGYGVVVYPKFLGSYRLVGHSGSVLVYTGFYGYIESEKLGVAVLANGSGYPPSMIGMYALTLVLGRDPEKELPFVRSERLLKRLEGRYVGYRGTVTVNVRRMGDFLLLEYSDEAMEWRLPLVPEELEEDHAVFWTLEAGRKLRVEFRIERDRVEMLYERYRLIKRA